MKMVDNVLVSDDVKDVHFVCKLSACCGDCCVEGDAGAPLEEEEISILEDYIDEIKPYMTEEGRLVIDLVGVFDYDIDASYVTPLVNDRECAFVYRENNINFCAIEKAFLEGKIPYKKPISCHLYPIRLSKVGDYTAVNYNQWNICAPALVNGKKLGVPLYKFLKEPLTRKFGEAWYQKLVVELEG
jgi:Fe-S-cluster containining protein